MSISLPSLSATPPPGHHHTGPPTPSFSSSLSYKLGSLTTENCNQLRENRFYTRGEHAGRRSKSISRPASPVRHAFRPEPAPIITTFSDHTSEKLMKILSNSWCIMTGETSGTVQISGIHTVFETKGNMFCLCARQSTSGQQMTCKDNFEIKAQAKWTPHFEPAFNQQQSITIVFGLKPLQVSTVESNTLEFDFYSVIINISDRNWSLERHQQDGSNINIATASDETLRPNTFISIFISFDGISLNIFNHTKPILLGIQLPVDTITGSGFGILGFNNKIIVKKFVVEKFNAIMIQELVSTKPDQDPELNTVNSSQLQSQIIEPKNESQHEVKHDEVKHDEVQHHEVGKIVNGEHKNENIFQNEHKPLFERKESKREPKKEPKKEQKKDAKEQKKDLKNHKDTKEQEQQEQRAKKSAYSGKDDRLLIEMIERDIIDREIGIHFDDIAALQMAKQLLNEAVVLPLLMPEYFTGIRHPWKGVLLFGPPGTGKTMLAKAVAGINSSTFFNCSASTLVSKLRGESEKLVRCLFNMARYYAPSIIFFDEIDALVSTRGSSEEHEASRRMKTEIFSQMDGINSSGDQENRIMVLATTNTPWDLDEAIRRRLEKRIYIPLPDLAARLEMLQLNFRGISLADDINLQQIAEMTDGYSGADLFTFSREASMMPIRRLIAQKSPQEIQQLRQEGKLISPAIVMEDLLRAVHNTRPSVSQTHIQRFVGWDREFGSKI